MDVKTSQLYKYAGFTALTAGILMVCMVVLMHLFPYSNMLRYEQVRPVVEYTSDLINGNMMIRMILTIDHIFLIMVLSTFVLVGQALRQEKNSLVITIAMIFAVATAVLDIWENHHVASMLTAALQNISISQQEINTQSILSLAKFHMGNIIFFLLAFFLPSLSKSEKTLRYILLIVLVPTSVMRYSFQDIMPVTVIPYIPIALGFLFASWVFYSRSKRSEK
jgi:hypothetical protein